MSLYLFPTDISKEYDTDERCSIIEILNTSNHKDVSIAQARVKPGVTTADHALRKTNEIYYILSGEGIATLEGEEIPMKVGDTLFIPREKSQYIKNTGEEDLIFLCICNPRFEFKNYKSL